jgi:hypothetical protein
VSWEDQGRNELGQFGDGKGPEKPKDTAGGNDIFGLGGLSQRIQAVLMARLALCRRCSAHARRRSTTRAIWHG